MKKGFCAGTFLVIFFMVVMGPEAVGAKTLYDDFSGAYIDAGKWEYREYVLEIDPVSQSQRKSQSFIISVHSAISVRDQIA